MVIRTQKLNEHQALHPMRWLIEKLGETATNRNWRKYRLISSAKSNKEQGEVNGWVSAVPDYWERGA
jgi:hypothetical protein